MLSTIILTLGCITFNQVSKPFPTYLVTSVSMWDNWFDYNFSMAKATGNELPITHVIFIVTPNDYFGDVSEAINKAKELGLQAIYGIRHSPDSAAVPFRIIARDWHSKRVRQLQLINTHSYYIDATLTQTSINLLNGITLFNASRPWEFLRKPLYIRGSPNFYIQGIVLQANRGGKTFVLDDSSLDFKSLQNSHKFLRDKAQYWMGHGSVYIPGVYLAYLDDPIIMRNMRSFFGVWFSPRIVEDDVVHFGLPEWNPKK